MQIGHLEPQPQGRQRGWAARSKCPGAGRRLLVVVLTPASPVTAAVGDRHTPWTLRLVRVLR